MIHQYKSNGYNIVLDVNSGAVHVVDELVFDILANLGEGTESINDFPVNATKIVKLNLIYSKDNVVVYAYMRDNKYYFETPYGGIFLTTEENYNKIKAIFNSAE